MRVVNIRSYKKFLTEWELNGQTPASILLQRLGYKSTVFIEEDAIWEMNDEDYVMFLLRWS